MKHKLTFAATLIVMLSQTACITTLHTNPYPRNRTVYVTRPRPVYVPVHRPAPTVVTVRRY